MVWFKVTDKLHSETPVRKVLATEPAALSLWVVAGSWSSDNLTDGLIPDHQLPWLIPTGAEQLARALVTAGLWRRVRGGYQFANWAPDQPLAADVLAVREKKAEAGRKGGINSGKARSKSEARASATATATAKHAGEPPTRPDPPPKGGEGRGVAANTSPPDRCRKHQGQPAHNCGLCRSEQLGGLDE